MEMNERFCGGGRFALNDSNASLRLSTFFESKVSLWFLTHDFRLNYEFFKVWSQAEGECCGGCVKRPDKGCAPVYRPVLDAIVNMDGATCYARGTMYTSACFGSCASLGAFLKNGIKMKECSCCDANEVEKVLLPVSCVPPKGPPGTMQIAALYDDFYEYDLITSCACNKFKCGDEWEPEGEEHKLKDLYNDVILNVNEYNGHV